jgi:hypothetical protein
MVFRPDPKPPKKEKPPKQYVRGFKPYKRSPSGKRILVRRKKRKYHPVDKEYPRNSFDIYEMSVKRKAKAQTPQKRIEEQFKNQCHLFDSIWSKRRDEDGNHYCENCGVFLPSPSRAGYFHHILKKGSFRLLRLREENIALVCDCFVPNGKDCHGLFHYGLKEAIEASKVYSDTERIKSLKELSKKLAAER